MTVTPTATLAAPALVAGRYRLGASLGRGGMGEVFEAVDERTGEGVAVKIVRRAAATPRALTRVLREASAAARVDHPNVVRVLDAGDDAENEVAFIAQELLRGETLREALIRRGALPPAEARAIAEAVAEGLRAVHAVGVVHRDLKPENIFLQRVEGAAPRPRVIDFGIARLVDPDADEAAAGQFTTTGTVLGTPRYMSPEQVRAAPDVDEQTDVWALGAVLFEMLTGDAPFARESPHATLAAILLDPIPPLHRDVPRALVEAVERALTRNRVERFGTMREFGDALRGVPVATTAPPRGRWLVLAAATFLLGLAMTWGWRASRQRATAHIAMHRRATVATDTAADPPGVMPDAAVPSALVASTAPPATMPTVVPSPSPQPRRGRRPPLGDAATDRGSLETTPEERSTPRVNGAPILWL